jgi:hypothetical protein
VSDSAQPGWRAQQARTVVVDGQEFVVRPRPSEPGTYDFDWTSGPYGYGFSSFGAALSPAEIEDTIRDFLAQVDTETGYID